MRLIFNNLTTGELRTDCPIPSDLQIRQTVTVPRNPKTEIMVGTNSFKTVEAWLDGVKKMSRAVGIRNCAYTIYDTTNDPDKLRIGFFFTSERDRALLLAAILGDIPGTFRRTINDETPEKSLDQEDSLRKFIEEEEIDSLITRTGKKTLLIESHSRLSDFAICMFVADDDCKPRPKTVEIGPYQDLLLSLKKG